jgi:CheY-like chemotaxis protein
VALALAGASVSVFIRAQGFQRPTKLILGLPTHFDFPRRFCYNEATNGSLRNVRKDGIVTEIATKEARVLCIEDQAGMLDLLRLILESAGYTFLGARDGVEGLEMMCSEQPDLILLDLMLPQVDGAEVLLKKKKDPAIRDIPVIAVTALASPFDQIMWKRHTEIEYYVTKPFKRTELLNTIERVLTREPH